MTVNRVKLILIVVSFKICAVRRPGIKSARDSTRGGKYKFSPGARKEQGKTSLYPRIWALGETMRCSSVRQTTKPNFKSEPGPDRREMPFSY